MVTTHLQCECGFEASAEDEDGLALEIRRHARDEHGMTLSLGEALQLASRARPVETRAPHRAVGIRQKEER